MKRLLLAVTALLLLFAAFSCGNSGNQNNGSDDIGAADSTDGANASATEAPYFIHLSDVHLDADTGVTEYGEDTRMPLWNIAKAKLAEVLAADPPPQFVVYTGDLPAHYHCSPTCFIPQKDRGDHNRNIEVILDEMRSLVAENGIPFYYMPGNNDALAGDYYSFSDSADQTPLSLVNDKGPKYPALNTLDNCGAPPCLLSNPAPEMGYYMAKPVKGLRLIALNSIILGRTYAEVDGVSQTDAGNRQMVWLMNQLAQSASSGDKVILAMHIPPGMDAYSAQKDPDKDNMWAHLPAGGTQWLDQFLSVVEKNKAHITGILYGHTHMDEVRRLYNSDGTSITEVAISAPGITPQHYNNPGFKIVWYDAESKELTDFETFYSTPDAEVWGTDSYRFSEIFGCAGSSIYECLAGKSLEDVNAAMDKIYTVMHGEPSYPTSPGIEVKIGQ